MDGAEFTVLWWGRGDPDYSRNRILRQCLKGCGGGIEYFYPRISFLADLEAQYQNFADVDIVWVPCFRQRDLSAAIRWACRHNKPLVFDPLISAYDKQVYERKKFAPGSRKANKLLQWEQTLFQKADLVIADTCEHARYYKQTLGVDDGRLKVVPVGAEETLFYPVTDQVVESQDVRILFYGSFLNLQGPEVVIEAARLYQGPNVRWQLVGNGPLLSECKKRATGVKGVEFLPWVDYAELPKLIQSADILLGIFGTSAKAARVIPNKVYQSLACGKPLVTRRSPAYPEGFQDHPRLGISWVEPGHPQQLADQVARLSADREKLSEVGTWARRTYLRHFSMASITASLKMTLQPLLSIHNED